MDYKTDAYRAARRKYYNENKVYRNRKNQVRRNKYKTNPGFAEQLNMNGKKRVRVATEYIHNLKRTLKCSNCPESRPACLDFHHVNPEEKSKQRKGSSAFNYSWSLDRIKAEIAKCIILCSNCHRQETWGHLYDDTPKPPNP